MSQLFSTSSRSAVRCGDGSRSLHTAAGLCTSSTVDSVVSSIANTTMTGVDCSVPLTDDKDNTCGIGCSDGTTTIDAAEDKNRKEVPDVISRLPNSQGENMFLNRTNDNCIKYGRKNATTTPVGINISQPSQLVPSQEPQRCSTLHSKNGTRSQSTEREPLMNNRHTPLSFIVTGGGPNGRSRRSILPEENVGSSRSGKRWILSDGPESRGETGEEPVLLSTVLDRGWGKMCEQEAAWWKQRCVIAEQQLAIAIQRVNEYCSATTTATTSLPSSSSIQLDTLETQEKEKTSIHSPLISELELENKRLRTLLAQSKENSVKLEEVERGSTVVRCKQDIETKKNNCIDVLINKTDREVQCMLDERCHDLQESVKLLRSERDTLRNELYEEVIKRENLETDLLAKEEHQHSQQEEWLSMECNLKKKQELLATSLRQTHLKVSEMSEQVEEKEKELQKAQLRIHLMEEELSMSKAEVMRLRETGEKNLQEGRRLQEQLQKLEADLYLHGDIKNENISGKDGSNLSDSFQEHTDGLLRRVVDRMRRVNSDEKWIASQLVQTLKGIGVTELIEKTDSSSLESIGRLELQHLVHSIETLIASIAKMLNDNDDDWKMTSDTVCEETYDTLSTSALNNINYADLLTRAKDSLSQLETCINAQKQRHMELREELEVVRKDRNELVGQQSKQVRHLQKLLLTAEQEKVRLMLDIEERDKIIRRLNEESSLTMSIKKPSTSSSEVKHISALESQDMKASPFPNSYLGRLLDHVNLQMEEFYHALHSRMMMAVESFAQLKGEELLHIKERAAALQGQLQRLREERVSNQRVQDECFEALRAQLIKVRAELAEKEQALRIALTAQIRQETNGRPQRSSSSSTSSIVKISGETTLRPEESLLSLPTPRSPSVTLPAVFSAEESLPPPSPPPPLLQKQHEEEEEQQQQQRQQREQEKKEEEDKQNQHHNGRDLTKPFEELRSTVSAHSYNKHDLEGDDALPIHFTGRSTPGRRTVTFAPSVIVVEEQRREGDDKEEEWDNKLKEYQQQANPLSYAALASRSPSSSFSSTSSAITSGKETQMTSQAIQRGVMRKHQEVWLRQAEIMGIPIDEGEHLSTTSPSSFMQLPSS
ncbi:uncharacterized protein TM35_000034650 [Trypanosoma theileri]|uniref:Uncharacterized protein n=1 Tax=Trypanosoma theileri TaxID=67003 RepID=A0A1X0P709_9TRYP|nr:uncharacterized protein TM35_000034650 [Trypanosoma theileri]ORC92712.1 hypothetical protein TM35_000034650 [Trypanosoma theileri]